MLILVLDRNETVPERSKIWPQQNQRRSRRDHDQLRLNNCFPNTNSKLFHQCHHKQVITNALPHHRVVSHHQGSINQAQQIMNKAMTQNKWGVQYTTCSRYLVLDLEPLKGRWRWSTELSHYYIIQQREPIRINWPDKLRAHFQLFNNVHSYLWQILQNLNCLKVMNCFEVIYLCYSWGRNSITVAMKT